MFGSRTTTQGDSSDLVEQLGVKQEQILILEEGVIRVSVSSTTEGARIWRRWCRLNPAGVFIVITLPGANVYTHTLQNDVQALLDYLR